MFETLAQGASHPAVAAWLGLGTAAVAAVVVAMAWSVNARQIRLAELMARRQFPVISGNGAAKEDAAEIEGAAAKEEAPGAKPAAAAAAQARRQATAQAPPRAAVGARGVRVRPPRAGVEARRRPRSSRVRTRWWPASRPGSASSPRARIRWCRGR